MDKETVLPALLNGNLPDRLEKGQTFNVARRSADLGENDVRGCLFAYRIDKTLDFVGNMRNNLYGLPEVLAVALLLENVEIDLSGGEVGKLVEVLVDEPFVVSEVEVGLAAVLGHIYFAVLIGTHRTGVNIDVRIQFLRGYLESAGL